MANFQQNYTAISIQKQHSFETQCKKAVTFNGRMGRMWNTLLLYKWKPIFAWLPIETLIRERRDAYYAALGQADISADATPFVEFLLSVIL